MVIERKSSLLGKITILIVIVLACSVTALGRTVYVDDDGPADFNNIQAAINDANDGDTVLVANGTYTGPGNRNIDFLGKAITVRSENGPENCIVDCQDLGRGFIFQSEEDANSVLSGITISSGGRFSSGGGIYCSESSPVIEDCIIKECEAVGYSSAYGGGIYIRYCSPLIENCVVTDCLAEGGYTAQGGGIYSVGSPVVQNCEISLNTATVPKGIDRRFYDPYFAAAGGGVFSEGSGSTKLIGCTVAYNYAWGGDGTPWSDESGANAYGGGICASYRGGDVTVTDCVITENVARSGQSHWDCMNSWQFNGNAYGGGIYGTAAIVDSTISYNCVEVGGSENNCPEGYAYGGGIYCTSGPIINCLIVGNWIDNMVNYLGRGEDLFLHGPVHVDKCTISYVVECESMGGNATITNSIIRFIYSADVSHCTAEYCCIEYVYPGGFYPGEGNIHVDPCFVLDDYENVDYHLKSQAGRYDPATHSWVYDDVTSPCIDAGNPLSPIGAEPFPNGGVVNMGAYGGTAVASKSYFGKPPCEIVVAGDVNGDCVINFLDFRLMALHWCEDNNP